MIIEESILLLPKIQPEECLGITRQDLLQHFQKVSIIPPDISTQERGLLAPTGLAKAFPVH